MKKRGIAALLCGIILMTTVACAPTSKEFDALTYAKQWMKDAIAENALMSFAYDGKAYSDHIKYWDKKVEDTEQGHVVTYKQDGLTVRTEITFNEKQIAYEWCSYFVNEGHENTAIVSDVLAVDAVLDMDAPILTTADGTSNSELDFQPYSVDLAKEEFSCKSTNGTPCTGAFPYFDIANGKHGVMGAIGWTGDWKMNCRYDNGKVSLQAGMIETSYRVYPDEQLRTPMIVLQFFKGDQDAGHNAWRRLMYEDYTPINTQTGQPFTHLPITINVWGGSTEQVMLNKIMQAQSSGLDYDLLWIDAGWYSKRICKSGEQTWIQELGNWDINRNILPNGFTKVDEALEEYEKGLLLWMMHEPVVSGSDFAVEHPDYLLPSRATHPCEIVDYSQDEVLEFMLDFVGGILEDAGAEWFRVDFYGPIAEKWKMKDAQLGADRIGVTEIKYITNLYRFYDGLKERIPGLMIDNCASGGTRLDIETVRRTICLWRSDLHASITKKGNADGTRHQAANTFWWLPLTTSGWSNDGSSTTYAFRSLFASGFGDYTIPDPSWHEEMMKQFAVTREMMTGDYYILSSGEDEGYDQVLGVYEFYLPKEDRGMIMAFRPANCTQESGLFKLKGLDPQTTYELEIVDNGQKLEMTGDELMTEGLALLFPSPQLSLVIYINQK